MGPKQNGHGQAGLAARVFQVADPGYPHGTIRLLATRVSTGDFKTAECTGRKQAA